MNTQLHTVNKPVPKLGDSKTEIAPDLHRDTGTEKTSPSGTVHGDRRTKMPIDQHGDSFGDRWGQVPEVGGDRGGCVVIHPLSHTCSETGPRS